MAKKTIGLCYFFDNTSNSGIVNYIFNIISGLKSLEADKRPNIIVFHSLNAPVSYLQTIDYPNIEFILFKNQPSNTLVRKANSLLRKAFKTDVYKQFRYFKKIDSLYPYFEFLNDGFDDAPNKIHWLVDFNNRSFPGHYSDKGEGMKSYQNKITSDSDRVVLSSNALFNELKSYHPSFKCDVKILRFACSLPELNDEEIHPLLEKHGIDTPYFMSPNQFWEHKNQDVILEALHILKTKHPGLLFKIVFTGSLDVNRGKGFYVDKLIKKIKDYDLEEHIMFLGILERNEQLLLMKHSLALLQPSLYEGWSTLVEEAKALNKFILLSDLPVHREQISVNVTFFDPHNANGLADKLYHTYLSPPEISTIDYQQNIREFGQSILDSLIFI